MFCWVLVCESDVFEFAYKSLQEYVFEIASGSQDLSRKLSRVNVILSGVGITPTDSKSASGKHT